MVESAAAVKLELPLLPVVAEPRPAVAVVDRDGIAGSAVVPVKLTCPLARVPPVTPAPGACRIEREAERARAVPAALVSLATMVWAPSARRLGGECPGAACVGRAVAAMCGAVDREVHGRHWIGRPGQGQVAVILSLVEDRVVAKPAVTTGTFAVLSMKESEALPELPAVSVSLATTVCWPSAQPVGVYDHAPVASAARCRQSRCRRP